MSSALALGCGLLLRGFLVHKFAVVQGDSLLYGKIAANWLQHGVFGYADPVRPTLIRLPGYPLFLALMFKLFGIGNYAAVLRVQIAIDLATCVLAAQFVRDHANARAANIALWLASLCPFTANYCALPLTETLSIFCVALAMLAASRCLPMKSSRWPWLLTLAAALSYSILLRPDGGLLAAAVLGYWLWSCLHSPGAPFYGGPISVGWGEQKRRTMIRWLTVSVLTLLPLVPWTARNWRTFHVIQPLAPRYANDPGELSEAGYKAWVKTWFVDFASNEEFYWCADDCPLQIGLLPNRAFDSPEQRLQTADLLDRSNVAQGITAPLDAEFAALARQRVADHPLRNHVELPVLRLADMLLRPRTEQFPVPARWWDFRSHRGLSWFSLVYAALNLGYLSLAAIGFARRRVPLAPMLLAYVVLRCALLMTLENAEPRYTLEFFPIVFVAAAFAVKTDAGLSTPPSDETGRLRSR